MADTGIYGSNYPQRKPKTTTKHTHSYWEDGVLAMFGPVWMQLEVLTSQPPLRTRQGSMSRQSPGPCSIRPPSHTHSCRPGPVKTQRSVPHLPPSFPSHTFTAVETVKVDMSAGYLCVFQSPCSIRPPSHTHSCRPGPVNTQRNVPHLPPSFPSHTFTAVEKVQIDIDAGYLCVL